MRPDAIGRTYAPALVEELASVAVGDELIVIGGPMQVVTLNPTAAMVFQFLDGESTIAELTADFGDALGLDLATVEVDVLEFVRDLARKGMLAGVEPDHVADPEPTGAFEAGTDVCAVALVDLDGARYSLGEHAGRRVILVNWSPSCGFCALIVADLANLAAPLADNGVDLVLLTTGDAASNRALVTGTGLEASLLRRADHAAHPFGALGTPSALLVDADGRVDDVPVLGADRIPEYLRALAGEKTTLASSTARYLPSPVAMCGPGGGATGNSTDWSGSRAYELANHRFGLRYNSESTGEVLDRLFRGARIEDPRAPDNYSVSLAPGRSASTRQLDLLVRGKTQLVRSRSRRRVLDALVSYLSAELVDTPPPLTRAIATAAVVDDRGVLLPPGLVDRLQHLQPRLAGAGVQLVDVPYATLDLRARDLVVPEPELAVDSAVLDALDDDQRSATELATVPPGRYPLDAWCFVRSSDDLGLMSTPAAVTAALPFVTETDVEMRERVEQLVTVFDVTRAVGLWYSSADELVEQVVAALR